MTPSEFKAWFDGFTEAFSGCPTKAQWGRIKERVAEIDGKPVTERVYVDRYWPSIPQYPVWRYCGTNGVGFAHTNAVGLNNASQQYASAMNLSNQVGQASAFNSMQAMADLGRAEALNLKKAA